MDRDDVARRGRPPAAQLQHEPHRRTPPGKFDDDVVPPFAKGGADHARGMRTATVAHLHIRRPDADADILDAMRGRHAPERSLERLRRAHDRELRRVAEEARREERRWLQIESGRGIALDDAPLPHQGDTCLNYRFDNKTGTVGDEKEASCAPINIVPPLSEATRNEAVMKAFRFNK